MPDAVTVRRVARAGEAVWWLNAVLHNAVPPDEAVSHLTGSVSFDGDAPLSWPLALGLLRSQGIASLALVVVAPGDPAGLPGPADVTQSAVAVGVAAVSDDASVTLLPVGDRWAARASTPRPASVLPLGTAAEARVLMRTAMAELTASFTSLEPDDEALSEIADLRTFHGPSGPVAVDPRNVALAGDALRVWWLTGVATRLCERRQSVRPESIRTLEPLARRATALAFSEPPR